MKTERGCIFTTYSCEVCGFENCAEIEKVKFTILQENIKSKTNDFKLHGLRGIKTRYVDIKFSAHERFWNNLHQVAQNRKIGKPNNLIVIDVM
jgi:hypothetical protein